ncbi:MAG: MFS transporter [Planctomycetota bacterium]|nr:MFS transporter [Planctomycetota bacterium]
MNSLRSNPALLCAFHALQMSLFPMAIITVFFKDAIGMSMGEIMLLQGAFGLALVLFEFPSGYLADRIGYRRALMIGAVLNAIGWTIYVRADTIPHILLAEIVLGIGISLISGTDSALLYESLEETGDEGLFGMWTGRVRFFGQFGEGTAAIVAGFVYAAWQRAPFMLEVGIWVINLWVAWKLVEPARHRPPATENWKQIKAMVRHLAVGDPKLRAIVVLTIALGMSSFIPVWTIQIYATEAGLAAGLLGVVWATANYSVALGSLYSTRVAGRIGLGTLLVVCIGLVAIGYAGLGLTYTVWGVGFYFVLTIMRGLNGPVLHHEEHRRIPSSDRAGFVSLRSLIFRGCFLVLGPLIGGSMDRWGQRPVLLAVGAGICAVAILGLVMVRRAGVLDEPLPGEAGA